MHALLIDDVQLVGDLVELEAPLVEDVARLLIVLRHLGRFGRRTMVEVPHELPVACELQDAVLIGFAADPHEPFRIDDDRLQLDRPLRMKSGAAPCVDDVSLLVGFDELRSTDAAERGEGFPSAVSSMGRADRPRLRNQTWSMWSTKIPTTCCMLHLFGSGLGQNGSTRYLRCAVVVHHLSS